MRVKSNDPRLAGRILDEDNVEGAVSELCSRNALTVAGTVVGASTVLYGGIVVTTALPAKMLGGAVIGTGLLYAGSRMKPGEAVFGHGEKAEAADKSESSKKDEKKSADKSAE